MPHNDSIKPLTTQQLQRLIDVVVAVTSYPAFFRVMQRLSETILSKETQRIFRSGIPMLPRPFGRLFAPLQVGAANCVAAC